MLSTAQSFVLGWAGVALVMALLWFVQYRRRNAGIVDVAWAFGTGLLGVWLVMTSPDGDPVRKILLAVLMGFWGLRLGAHLAGRVARETEDGRYLYLREVLGSKTQPVMFVFFQLQAGWAVMFATPVWAAAQTARGGLDWLDIAGVVVWAGALFGEWVADRQLDAFRSNPANRGNVCQDGLWRYSRHPNYFFEWLHWFAYILIGVGSNWWWLTVAGMLVMLVFITRITGIPYTEKQALRSRGAAYEAYQRSTSAFFPLPPNRRRQEPSL